jgi:hypothetical protein
MSFAISSSKPVSNVTLVQWSLSRPSPSRTGLMRYPAIVQKHHKRLFEKIHVKDLLQKVEGEGAFIAFFYRFSARCARSAQSLKTSPTFF